MGKFKIELGKLDGYLYANVFHSEIRILIWDYFKRTTDIEILLKREYTK